MICKSRLPIEFLRINIGLLHFQMERLNTQRAANLFYELQRSFPDSLMPITFPNIKFIDKGISTLKL